MKCKLWFWHTFMKTSPIIFLFSSGSVVKDNCLEGINLLGLLGSMGRFVVPT